jgi:phosphoglycerate dehydrogenase-like enzyme
MIMTNVLLIIDMPEPVRRPYADDLHKKFPQLAVDLVENHAQATAFAPKADVIMTFGPMMQDHVLREAPNLKWIQALTTGTDGVDDLPSLRPEIVLTSMHGIHGDTVAEAALAGMFVLSRNLIVQMHSQDKHQWGRIPARLLHGKTVGIFGIGAIGDAMAQKCKALGMSVIGVDPVPSRNPAIDRMLDWNTGVAALPEMDHVVLLMPSNEKTRGIVNADFIGRMKRTAYLVNVARGAIIDDAALLDALRNNRIAGAYLDAFAKEPLPADHPYWTLPNVLITPHNAGNFDEYEHYAWPIIEENMKKFLTGDCDHMINRVPHAPGAGRALLKEAV